MPLSSRSLQERLRDVRDVAGDFLRPELGVARLDLELLDVDRRVVVVLHHPLGDEDRVLEVVAAPRHERDEHVPAERQLAELGARTVAEHLPLVHLLADPDDRLLGDAGVLVRPLELRHRVDVGAHLLADVVFGLALDADDDALAVDVVDGARPARHDDRARIARGDVLHAGADKRRTGRGAAAPPGAACSIPSARGWRRRSRGTGSARRRPRRAASARRR